MTETLYAWASSGGIERTLTVAVAQWLVFVVPAALAAAWWLPSLPSGGRADRRRALVAGGAAGVLAVVATLALGLVVDRTRPFVVLHLVPLFPHAVDSSFPSDHTMIGVALPAPLAWRRQRLGWALAAVGILAGVGRVAAGVHWPSDILGTAALALVLSAFALAATEAALTRIPQPWLDAVGLAAPPLRRDRRREAGN